MEALARAGSFLAILNSKLTCRKIVEYPTVYFLNGKPSQNFFLWDNMFYPGIFLVKCTRLPFYLPLPLSGARFVDT